MLVWDSTWIYIRRVLNVTKNELNKLWIKAESNLATLLLTMAGSRQHVPLLLPFPFHRTVSIQPIPDPQRYSLLYLPLNPNPISLFQRSRRSISR